MDKKVFWLVLALTVIATLVSWGLSVSADVEPIKLNEKPIPVKEQFKHDAEKVYQEHKVTVPNCELKIGEIEPQFDIDLMARVVMSEASTLDFDGKHLVAVTMINRLHDGRWGDTIEEVIYYPNAYSTADNGEPTTECYEAVYEAIRNQAFPEDLFYFRADKPHDFGYVYAHIGNTYFSTETDYERSEDAIPNRETETTRESQGNDGRTEIMCCRSDSKSHLIW